MDEEATIESQFAAFSKLFDNTRSGATITLYRSDYWLRQAAILDDSRLTTTDTGLCFFKFSKTELKYGEWCEMISELCAKKKLHEEDIINRLTNCDLPEKVIVKLREFRSYFETYVPKNGLVNIGND
ncbi:unnamed protein product [Arctia plantaginis]|uniref:Uncharacterized protein n=1 Tax=Arctia plantaginis TaxID=874455 RepID=A0A8S1BIY1_ARCPL|nr:unnamed protein product [Arctia plantaginis]